MSHQGPPRYVLLSSGSGGSNALTRGSPFAHLASIHYQYADDQPLQLLPPGSDIVLVMDIEDAPVGSRSNVPNVRSLSSDVVVTSVKVSEVPGANLSPSLTPLEDLADNPNMYVIDLAARGQGTIRPSNEAEVVDHTFISRFKEKNDYLRRILDYGETAPRQPSSPLTADPNANFSTPSTSSLSPPPEASYSS
ncbi:hypothetical protein FRB94_011398 [Tulasnella sp. JGI-2019a]|nr:hypothetical protein FRB94_011398 [Tulasnella sp. JGI-2019a]KAG9002063.1 hypothetical protein FRB93_011834 [Tulasnella sp. JGI-2019a]